MDNINSKRMNAIKDKISKIAEFAFNDFSIPLEDIREFNIGLFKSNEQNSTDDDIESKMGQVIQDDFYKDFDDLNDDDNF